MTCCRLGVVGSCSDVYIWTQNNEEPQSRRVGAGQHVGGEFVYVINSRCDIIAPPAVSPAATVSSSGFNWELQQNFSAPAGGRLPSKVYKDTERLLEVMMSAEGRRLNSRVAAAVNPAPRLAVIGPSGGKQPPNHRLTRFPAKPLHERRDLHICPPTPTSFT